MSTYTRLSAANAADADYFLNSVDMKVGAFTLDETTIPTAGARKVTVKHTAVGTADTLGTVTIVGKDLAGQTITEVITPLDGDTASGVKWFKSITSATGAGWVVDEVEETADTIEIGYGADVCVVDGPGYLESVIVNTTAAATVVIADAKGTIATLKASIGEGVYSFKVGFTGYLTVDVNGASNVTLIHSPSLPSVYA